MNKKESEIYESQKELVLARFKTLDPDAKIVLGGKAEVTVRDIISHIKRDDEFGKKAVLAQMEMLKVLANA